jgi:uncharacterized lipoprotein YehR (DUF1307 family)
MRCLASLAGLVAALALGLALAGCEEKSSVKKQTTVTTPEGKSTKTVETTLETKGDNPPPVNGAHVPATNP